METGAKRYFTNAILAQYQEVGFANVLKALDYLPKFWARQNDSDWIKLLTDLDVFVF